MNYFHALILGIVEGITEFLPVSSTGHLILTSKLLALTSQDFLKTFDIVIQLGAVLAALCLYGKRVVTDFPMMQRVAAAFLPTALFGLIFYKVIKKYLLNNEQVVLASLALGGIFLILFELWHKENPKGVNDSGEITFQQAVLIGLCQCLAMIPGVSRSAATICGGLLLGLERKTIVEFSFLLAIPTMAAASGLDLIKNAALFSSDQWRVLAIGFATSFFVALLGIKFLLYFIERHNFILFGVYRIFVSLAFWFFILR